MARSSAGAGERRKENRDGWQQDPDIREREGKERGCGGGPVGPKAATG
jgi:hypothetical protein